MNLFPSFSIVNDRFVCLSPCRRDGCNWFSLCGIGHFHWMLSFPRFHCFLAFFFSQQRDGISLLLSLSFSLQTGKSLRKVLFLYICSAIFCFLVLFSGSDDLPKIQIICSLVNWFFDCRFRALSQFKVFVLPWVILRLASSFGVQSIQDTHTHTHTHTHAGVVVHFLAARFLTAKFLLLGSHTHTHKTDCTVSVIILVVVDMRLSTTITIRSLLGLLSSSFGLLTKQPPSSPPPPTTATIWTWMTRPGVWLPPGFFVCYSLFVFLVCRWPFSMEDEIQMHMRASCYVYVCAIVSFFIYKTYMAVTFTPLIR